MAYHYSKILKAPFDSVLDKVISGLKQEGFEMITAIDISNNLRQFLQLNFRHYHILSACNPVVAYKAITLDSHIGLMLCCHIIIQQHENGQVEVSARNPLEGLADDMITPSLEAVAIELSDHLCSAIDSVYAPKEKLTNVFST